MSYIFLKFENHTYVGLQYLFNVFILFNTVLYFKLIFKLKIDPKVCDFNNLKKI